MKRRSLSSVLARLIWLCMVPLVLLAAWLSWSHLQDREVRHLQEADNLARNFATTMDHSLDAKLRALNILALSPLADDPHLWPALYREAQGFRASFDTHVIFADEQRQMLFNTRLPYGAALPHLPIPRGRSAVPIALKTGKPQIGDIVQGPGANLPLVLIVVPVVREDKPTRLMLSLLEIKQIQHRIEQIVLPKDWSVALQDSTGADIARRSPSGFDSRRDVDADHRFVIPLKQSPWSVVLEIPRSTHAAMHLKAMVYLGATLLMAILLGLVGGMLFSRRFAGQVRALAQARKVNAVDTMVFDITELAEARHALDEAQFGLQESRERLQLLIDHAPVALALFDSDMRYLALSLRWREDFELGDQEVLGRSHYEVFPNLLEEWKDGYRRGLAGEVVRCPDGEPWVRSDGQLIWNRWEVLPWYRADGGIAGIVIFVENITESKLAEQKLELALEEQKTGRLAALNLMDDARAAQLAAET